MSDESTSETDRRSLLGAVATGAFGTAFLAGSAAADSGDGVEPSACYEEVYQHKCEEWDCSCCDCDYDCGTLYERMCCKDRYGNIKTCGDWYATNSCC
ncbi:hypothetical protein BRC81_16725 [Halobacteriales archaeon QS_1_68_20]|nr:MAG: hypothetical protein BRC81_16725 [Halobacteriales archaeon QS_1_68_20]